MTTYYWNDWYTGWGWLLWYGMVFLVFSMFANWGYTYSAHRKFRDGSFDDKDALDYLNDRYAKGEIMRDEYIRIKNEILSTSQAITNTTDVSELKKSPMVSAS